MAAAEVLAKYGVQKRLPRPSVTHLQRDARLNAGVRNEVVLDERFHGPDANLRRDVSGLQLAQNLLDENTVADLDGQLSQVFVGAMHRITEL